MSGARAKAVPWSTRHEAVGRMSYGQARTVWPLARYVPPPSLRPWPGPMPGCLAPLYLYLLYLSSYSGLSWTRTRWNLLRYQFKGRALEKHGPVVLAQAQQKARQTQEAEAASCRRALDPPPPLPSILYSRAVVLSMWFATGWRSGAA
ncbi:hypothetical protein HDV62DRAFT_384169 [Trichoderma sp. SZMC 28011]